MSSFSKLYYADVRVAEAMQPAMTDMENLLREKKSLLKNTICQIMNPGGDPCYVDIRGIDDRYSRLTAYYDGETIDFTDRFSIELAEIKSIVLQIQTYANEMSDAIGKAYREGKKAGYSMLESLGFKPDRTMGWEIDTDTGTWGDHNWGGTTSMSYVKFYEIGGENPKYIKVGESQTQRSYCPRTEIVPSNN